MVDTELGLIPWVSKQLIPPRLHTHPLIEATLQASKTYAQIQAKRFFRRGKFLRIQDLAALSNTKSFPSWSYMQLKHFLDVPSKILKFTNPPTIFESLCSSSSPQSHVISALYASMFGESQSSLHSDHAFWELVLDREIGEARWDRIHLYIHKGSQCPYAGKWVQAQNEMV